MGTPRSSLRHRSARVPPTRVMGAEKAMPSMARHTSRVPMFLATAQGTMKMTAMSSVEPLDTLLAFRSLFSKMFLSLALSSVDLGESKAAGQGQGRAQGTLTR